MAGDRPLLVGIVLYLCVAVAPALIFWLLLRVVPLVVGALCERRRRRRPPVGPSCETLVAHLRRLRREVRGRPPSTQVRRVALLAAYDETLVQVCRMTDVDAPLADATGPDRAFARLLTEAALEAAGVALDPPGGAAAA